MEAWRGDSQTPTQEVERGWHRQQAPRSAQALFLGRIRRMLHLSKAPHLAPWQRTLVNKALYSTYVDCLRLGVGEKAQLLLEGSRGKAARPISRNEASPRK